VPGELTTPAVQTEVSSGNQEQQATESGMHESSYFIPPTTSVVLTGNAAAENGFRQNCSLLQHESPEAGRPHPLVH
jgi:hypothetical protein